MSGIPIYAGGEQTGLPMRQAISALQEKMATMESAADQCVLKHHFAPGCYARELTMPKGLLIIGKIHRHSHLNIISKGKVSVVTEFGTMHMEAPCTFVSEVGTKRVVYTEEETVWTTIHPTEETDLEKIEAYVIAPSYKEIGLIDSCKTEQIEVKK